MRILHVIPSVDPTGGGPIEGVKQLSGAARRRRHLVEIASLDAPDSPCLGTCSLPVYALGPGQLKYGFSRRLVPWLASNAPKYDIVVVNGIWQYHAFATWKALRNSGVPYVVFTHGMLSPWFKRTYAFKHLKKWLYWPWADYRVLRDAAAVLFTCEEERLRARESFGLYRCNEIVVKFGTASPGGDPVVQRTAFFKAFPQLADKRVILFMGRLHPIKGCDLLIEAFARTMAAQPDWHLLLAGPDQVGWQDKLSSQATRLGISERITWAGMLSGDLKWGAFHAADALALPSHHESFGMVVAEALACGLPVLISNQVNIWREIQADEAGLVGNDDLQGTCQLLHAWMEMPKPDRQRMRQQARNTFEERFEVGKAAESLTEVLCFIKSQQAQHICPTAAPIHT